MVIELGFYIKRFVFIYRNEARGSTVFDKKIRITLLGNTGVGKTTLIDRMKGNDVRTVKSHKSLDINIEQKKIRLVSSDSYPWYHPETYRKYQIIAIDNPGDYTLRRKWREVLRNFKTDGMLFILDPLQSLEVQRSAMEDSFNYFLDSLDLNPAKADEKGKKKKYIFHFVVNKCDTLLKDPNKCDNFELAVDVKDRAIEFLSNFTSTMDAFKENFPKSLFGISYISAIYSPYRDIDKLFEVLKVHRFQV
jgi:GTPase SAR1 family protein